MSNRCNYQKVTSRCIPMVALPVRRSWILKKRGLREKILYNNTWWQSIFKKLDFHPGRTYRGTRFTFHLLRMSYKRRSRYSTEDQFWVFPYKEVNVVKDIRTFSDALKFVFSFAPLPRVHSTFIMLYYYDNLIGKNRRNSGKMEEVQFVRYAGLKMPPPPAHVPCFLLMMTGSPQACTCPHLGRPDWLPWTWSTALSLERFQMRVEPHMDVTSRNFHMNSRQDVDFLFVSHPTVCHTGHYGVFSSYFPFLFIQVFCNSL